MGVETRYNKGPYVNKVALRFELRMGALQAPALPLGYATEWNQYLRLKRKNQQNIGGNCKTRFAAQIR